MARRKIAELRRDPNSVFVSVQPPEPVQQTQQAKHYFSDWTQAASDIASDEFQSGLEIPIEDTTETTQQASVRSDNLSLPEAEVIPTAEDLLAAHLPHHIADTRWAMYITPSEKCRVFDGTVFVYNHPNPAFWNLYNLSKGIFRDLGILLSRSSGTWEARIPVKVLTDKVFVDSGLAGVEATLRTRKPTDDNQSFASKISSEIRNRQFQRTARGIAKVKQMRESLADAAGVMAIAAVSWLSYIIMGGVV